MLKSQTKVGLLLIATSIIAAGVIMNLGNIRLTKGYKFYILFDDLADLPTRPVVKIAGVEVGRVTDVELYRNKARVQVWIDQKIKIHKDSRAKILKLGLIGNTFISLTRGTPAAALIQNGDTINGIDSISYEAVIESFVAALDKVMDIFQNFGSVKELGESINQTARNLTEASEGIKNALGPRGSKLSQTIDNINSVLLSLDAVLKGDVKGISRNIEKFGMAAEELKNLIASIREGQGPIGKMFTSKEYGQKVGETIDSIHKASMDFKQAINRLKGFDMLWNAGVYYEPDSELFRTNSGLTFRTSSKRFLSIALENIDPDNRSFDAGGDRINALSVKAGKKFGSFTVFGGAIRSTGGIGFGWGWNNRLKIKTEIFDFTRSINPWWTISSGLKLTSFLNLAVSYEDMLEEGKFRTGLEVELD